MLSAIANSPFVAGAGPVKLAVHPSGKFVYAANVSSNTISGYMINPLTGALTAVVGSPFADASGSGPGSVAVDPSGKFAYVANSFPGFTIPGYAINPATGALTPLARGLFFIGENISNFVATYPGGEFVYEVGLDPNIIAGFRIDPLSGALTTIAGFPFPTGSGPVWMVFTPVKPGVRAVYITNEGSKTVSVIGPSTNSVVATIIVGPNPVDAAITPNGSTAYIITEHQSRTPSFGRSPARRDGTATTHI